MAVFDKKPAGIDIEVMKERNFEMIYRFWKKTPQSKFNSPFFAFKTAPLHIVVKKGAVCVFKEFI